MLGNSIFDVELCTSGSLHAHLHSHVTAGEVFQFKGTCDCYTLWLIVTYTQSSCVWVYYYYCANSLWVRGKGQTYCHLCPGSC